MDANAFNIALDGYSAVICAIMAGYVLVGDDRRDPVNRCFVGICITNVIMALGDLVTWIWAPPLSPVQTAVVCAGNFLFWAMPAPMFLCFTEYIASYLRRRCEVPRGYLRLSIALFTIYLTGCVASLFNGMFFTVTPEAGYTRGDWFLAGQVVPVLLHARNGMLVWRYREHLQRKEIVSFLAYITLPFAAEALQVPLFGLALMNTAVTLATIIVFMNIQAEHRATIAERDRQIAEARGDIMLSQIQPHFLYNTLTAIRELCLTDPGEAARTITSFSRYLRENMASLTSRDPIPFERELEHVRTYLELEQRRFGERLNVGWDIGPTNFFCPPLVVQPLVENAVRHGVTKRVEGGRVRIATYRRGDTVVVEVEDDGIGFDISAPPVAKDGHQQVGIANVRTRLEAICRGRLEIESAPGTGTVARIVIPQGASHE